MRLTPSQVKAVETLDMTVSVSAGAGSGKTEVLVQRFCGIVRDGRATVDEILAVTYTEKAAKEMKQRIVRELTALSQEADGARFEEERRRVESAYIGTIHSFATRLLRENAFEAGVDPRYRVMDEAEGETLKDTVLDDLIADWHEKGVEACVDLLQAYDIDSLKSGIVGLHRHLRTAGDRVWQIPSGGVVYASPREFLNGYTRLVDDLIRLAKLGELNGKIGEQILQFAPSFPSLKAAMEELCRRVEALADPLREYAQEFDWDLYEEARAAGDFVKNNVGSKDIKEDYVKPAKAFARDFLFAVIEPLADHYMGCLRTMTDEFGRRYESAKMLAGALDFDDLLLKTRDLLVGQDGHSAAAEEYLNRFKFVIMDEFQDTNLLQKTIVESVCPAGRFFCVGDPKQSIYRFNNADVSVFIENHRKVNSSPDRAAISFIENFRSRPEILSFVNALFDRLWASDPDLEFEKLEAKAEFGDTSDAVVELLLVPQEKDASQARLLESRAIASRICQLLGCTGGRPFQVTRKRNPDDKPRDLQPGDIMILFRSTAEIPLYEKALFDAGIPFYVVSGRGFYETHEVSDIHSLLKVVDNALDDVSMAAVLRSPMVGVSDDALWWLTRAPDSCETNREIGKLYAGLQNLDALPEIDQTDRDKLTAFIELLDELRGLSAGCGITDLLDTAIRRTAYDLKTLASSDGKRRYANIRKLLDLAQSCQSTGQFHLPDFIHHIESLKVMAQREGEAPTETEDSPVVRMMTVHKAKGLQAPVVFVADSSRPPRLARTDAFMFSNEQGVSCKLKNLATDEMVVTAEYERQKAELRDADLAEEKRLFYVAATRAEELLVISGRSKYDGKAAKKGIEEHTCWSGWLESVLQIGERPCSGRERKSYGDSEFNLLDGTGLVDVFASDSGQTLSAVARLEQVKLAAEYGGEGMNEVADRCRAVISVSRDAELVLTVSRILDYVACPRMYYCRWVLGIQEESPDPKDMIPDDEADVSSTTLGTAVHQVLRAVDFSKALEPQLDELAKLQTGNLLGPIEDACKRFLASSWAERICRGSQWLQEVPLRLKLGTCDFRGRADLLFKDESGWVVADYKTGGGVDSDRYRRQVGIYALAVERCLGVPPSEAVVISLRGAKDYVQQVNDSLINETEAMVNSVAEGIRREDFEPCKSDECDHCSYKIHCGT